MNKRALDNHTDKPVRLPGGVALPVPAGQAARRSVSSPDWPYGASRLSNKAIPLQQAGPDPAVAAKVRAKGNC